MNIDTIISKPKITEKALKGVSQSLYVFEVNLAADKHKIKQSVESLFNVVVSKVRIIVRKGKKRRIGKRMNKKQLPDKKIAYVSVSKGTIDLFPKT